MAVISLWMLNKNEELNFSVEKSDSQVGLICTWRASNLAFFFFFKRHLKWHEKVENSRIEKSKSDPKRLNTVGLIHDKNSSNKSIKGKKEVYFILMKYCLSRDVMNLCATNNVKIYKARTVKNTIRNW